MTTSSRESGDMTAGRHDTVNVATPRPWLIFTTTDGRKLIGIGDKDGQGILDSGFGVWAWKDAEGLANAELVVRAVNNHDALVHALSEIVGAAEHCGDEDAPVVIQARKVLYFARHGKVPGSPVAKAQRNEDAVVRHDIPRTGKGDS